MDNLNNCVLRDCGIAELKAVDIVTASIQKEDIQNIKTEYSPIGVLCSGCPFNDGLVYTSNPPCYKCTKDGQWHGGTYGCGKVYVKTEYIYME